MSVLYFSLLWCIIFSSFISLSQETREQLSVRFGISDKVRHLIVDQHNNFRRLIANGKISNQPSAANMKIIRWNPDLEMLSRLWADKCTFKHRSTDYHDKTNACGAAGHDWVAENLFVKSTHSTDGPKRVLEVVRNVKHAINVWFNEHAHFSFPHNCTANKLCGHYTQIAWANTEEIGCAISLCKNIDHFRYKGKSYNFVCSYGAGGNIDGKAPYLIGKGGTRCPRVAPLNLNGLCGGSGQRLCENVESSKHCEFWKNQGLCQMCQPTYSFMLRNCYKTCNFCNVPQSKWNSISFLGPGFT